MTGHVEELFLNKWQRTRVFKSQHKNEKYVNVTVRARVRLMVRGGCLPVRYQRNTDAYCFIKLSDQMRRRWLSVCDVLDERERTVDVIKGYVEMKMR